MSVSLFLTDVDHCRIAPKVHKFSYRTLSVLIDLTGLVPEQAQIGSLSYNRRGLFSIWDKDFLPGATGSIREKLRQYLTRYDKDKNWTRIELLTGPRFLGFVFSPVSFFLCYENDRLVPALCVAQVNNTFGETHLYVAEPDPSNSDRRVAKFITAKDFHVSPFLDRKGDYEFYVERSGEKVDVRVNLIRDGEMVFTSGVMGNPSPAVTPSRLRTFLWGVRYGWLTLPRIVWQAFLLRFLKGLPVFKKPIPTSKATIGKRTATWTERLALRFVVGYLARLKEGALQLVLPSGEVLRFGEVGAEATARITIVDWSFFPRVLFGGDVAFGECYTDGLWESEDLLQVLCVFAENTKHFDDRDIPFTKLLQRLNAFIQRRRANSKTGSRVNIAAHYDLGNELFRRFLDGRLVYSCAVFEAPEETLEQAQLNKLNRMIQKADILPGHHVLEIGTGWGAFAVEAVKATGCRVTTITLSEEQRQHAQQLVDSEGLSDRIQVLLCDYRDIEGQFDRIVSIEMLEAVGHEQLGLFFEICNRLLLPDGVVALQFITVPDSNYDKYRRSCDWIQKYVFPGGHCPSLTAVCNATANHSPFLIEHIENIGPSYARTLNEWRVRFRRCSDELLTLGYDARFQRMWEYYLSYCEAGFANRILGTLQVVLTRPNNREMGLCPGYSNSISRDTDKSSVA